MSTRQRILATFAALSLLAGCGQAGARPAVARAPQSAQALAAKVAPNFMWGVATAGHQWEGGDTASNWARWIAAGKTADPNDEGVQGFARFEEDLDLAAGLGVNTFRLSLEWSRLEPEPGRIDPAAVAHYHRVLAAVRARGMTPVVTLMHFAYPAWLDAEGGWESARAVEAYTRYARFAAKEFGSDIQYYLTFNEPNMFVLCGWGNGSFPPGKRVGAWSGLQVTRHLIAAHKAAYAALHEIDADAQVSFNMYAAAYAVGQQPGVVSAFGPGDPLGTEGFLAETLPSSRGGKGTLDFACFDYYCRLWVGFPLKVVPHDQWEVYPQGFYEAIKRYHRRTGLPVLVAENGMATYDLKPRPDGWNRASYMVAHVQQMQRAMAEGVPVLGYIHWSITDNYEWGTYTPRFGLYSVEAKAGDFRRVPTEGVAAFRAVIAQGGVDAALAAAYPPPPPRTAARTP